MCQLTFGIRLTMDIAHVYANKGHPQNAECRILQYTESERL